MRQILKSTAETALRALRPLYARDDEVIILPPADSGSAGDQAMLDATAGHLTHRLGRRVSVLHVMRVDDPIPLRVAHSRLPAGALGRRDALSRSLRLRRAGAVLALGADVIDGVYAPANEMRKLGMMASAAAAGARIAVLGCSISQTPSPQVAARLRAMGDLRIFLRDEISFERFERLAGRKGELVADTAFLLDPAVTAESGKAALAFLRAQRAAGRTILAFNASGHTLHKAPPGALDALAQALRTWLDGRPDRAVLIVPHDIRPAPTGDLEAGTALAAAAAEVAADRAHLLAPPFNAWDIKALMGEVDLVMTGRMHMAIAAMGMGTPTFSVVYQGKYEGLMRHFGVEGLLMQPDEAADPARVAQGLAELEARAPALRAQIAARLPAVLSLARRNFDWLETGR